MADPAQLESIEGQDRVPELPTATDIAAAYGGAAIHNPLPQSPATRTPDDEHPPVPRSPSMDTYGAPLRRTVSSTSRVDIGHFDPEGVEQLRRTMTMQSQSNADLARCTTRHGDQRSSQSRSSEATLTLAHPIEGPFDFEKALRNVFKR